MDDLFLNKTPPDALDKWCYGKAMVHIFRDLPGHDYVEFYDAFEALQQCRDAHEMHERFHVHAFYEGKGPAEIVKTVIALGNGYYLEIMSLFDMFRRGLMAPDSGFDPCIARQADMRTLFNLGYTEFLKGVG